MSTQKKRPFDATWLPFGMSLGTAVGIGTGLVLFDNLFLGAIFGFAIGALFGVMLGRAGGRNPDKYGREDDPELFDETSSGIPIRDAPSPHQDESPSRDDQESPESPQAHR